MSLFHILYSLLRIALNNFMFVSCVNRPQLPSDSLYWPYIGPGLRKQDLGKILEWWLMGEHFWKKTCLRKTRIKNVDLF